MKKSSDFLRGGAGSVKNRPTASLNAVSCYILVLTHEHVALSCTNPFFPCFFFHDLSGLMKARLSQLHFTYASCFVAPNIHIMILPLFMPSCNWFSSPLYPSFSFQLALRAFLLFALCKNLSAVDHFILFS
jgi:hypothetical protein